MATSKTKNHLSSALVVSTDCSRIKSFYPDFLCRLSNPKSPMEPSRIPENTASFNIHSPNWISEGKSAAQAYWRRAHQLEMELIQLNKWISIEKNLRDCIDNKKSTHWAKVHRQRTKKGTKVTRLVNGSYMYDMNMKATGEPWGRLAMQISAPAILQMRDCSNISQVLKRMASMGREKLTTWLLESMPIDEVQCKTTKEVEGTHVYPGKGDGFMEDILLAAMDKMEILVLESLSLQVSAKVNDTNVKNKRGKRAGGHLILVMLVQVRDPEQEYEAVGDLMIGLVEASFSELDESGIHIEGVHVAGTSAHPVKESLRVKLSYDDKRIWGRRIEVIAETNHLWSVSAKNCKGGCQCCRAECVRNPDMMLAP